MNIFAGIFLINYRLVNFLFSHSSEIIFALISVNICHHY